MMVRQHLGMYDGYGELVLEVEWTGPRTPRWRRWLWRVLGLRWGEGALARDFCETMHQRYPAEAEDGFEQALAESRPEQ